MSADRYAELPSRWEEATTRFLQVRLGRGKFVIGTIATGLVLTGLPNFATPVHAARETWIKNETNWFPYDVATVARDRATEGLSELPSLVQPGGPIHLYDLSRAKGVEAGIIITDEIVPIITDARSLDQKYADDRLAVNLEDAHSLGHCRALAIIGGEDEPDDYFAPEFVGLLDQRDRGSLRVIKVGLKEWYHSSDPALFYTEDQNLMRSQLGRLWPQVDQDGKNYSIIINAPQPGRSGRWYRRVVDIGSQSVMATNFGYGYKEIPFSWIRSMEVPVHIEQYYGRICENNYPADIQRRLVDIGTNPHRDERWIRHLLTGEEYKSYTGKFLDLEELSRSNKVVFR